MYFVKNHAENAKLHIQLEKFKTKESAVIQLLKPSDLNPTQSREAMRLNLVINGTQKIKSLNEMSTILDIGTLNPKGKLDLQFEGTYFGDIKKEKQITNYSMIWKFSAQI